MHMSKQNTTIDKPARLRPSTILLRILSLCSCAFGASASIYSLLIQFNETSNIQVSICWFAGLFAFIGGIAGYAITNLGKRQKSKTWIFICAVLIASAVVFIAEKTYLPLITVIITAIVCVVIQGTALIITHFVLKKRDPYAL